MAYHDVAQFGSSVLIGKYVLYNQGEVNSWVQRRGKKCLGSWVLARWNDGQQLFERPLSWQNERHILETLGPAQKTCTSQIWNTSTGSRHAFPFCLSFLFQESRGDTSGGGEHSVPGPAVSSGSPVRSTGTPPFSRSEKILLYRSLRFI